VVVVACLARGRAVFVPLALSVLLTFLLAPVVGFLQRWLGRVGAVLVVVVLAFSVLGAVGWVMTQQLTSLADELPRYRDNIRQKVADVRGASRGGSLEKVQETVKDIQEQIAEETPGRPPVAPVPVVPARPGGRLWNFPTALGPVLDGLATAGLVVILVIFMLLEREELRSRIIRLFGTGQLAVATKAVDEAGRRIGRYLGRQSLINGTFGLGAGLGLLLLGVPYAFLWGILGAVLRFLPYVGPWAAALGPILLGLAVFEGWTRPLLVAGLYVVLELVTNMVLETVLYAGAAGVSQVGLLVAVAFWTWLWGPLGLLLATPLTVCLVVLARHVRGLEVVAMLIGDEPVLGPGPRLYQRLLAQDQDEATEVLEEHLARHGLERVYDDVVIPALALFRRDGAEGRLHEEDERAVLGGLGAVLDDVVGDGAGAPEVPAGPPAVLGVPAGHPVDALALHGLARALAPAGIRLEVASDRLLSSEVAAAAASGEVAVVCVAAVAPGGLAQARYVVKRLRARAPGARLVVGRWGAPGPDPEAAEALRAAGADQVTQGLGETREAVAAWLQGLGRGAPERAPSGSVPATLASSPAPGDR
jgi:predicted PurR-regulated permease PerM